MTTPTEFDCKYYIVEFNDGLQLIPKNWFCNGGREAYWPNFKNYKLFEKAVEEMMEVKEDWKTHRVRNIYGKSNSFERGKQKLKDAEIYTDLSTDCEEQRKYQRHQIAKKRILSSSSSSSDASSDEFAKDILPLPKVPKSNFCTPERLFPEGITEKYPKYTSTPKTVSLVETSTPTPKSCQVQANNTNTPPLTSQKKTSNDKDESNSTRLVLRAISGLNYKLAAMANTQTEILKRIECVEEYVKKLPERQEQHSRDDAAEQLNESGNIRSLFPVDNDEMMGALESKLEDNAFKFQVVKEFSKIGGKDIKSIVYNLLPHLMTDSYAYFYSWYGAKGKKVFASLTLATVIQEVVRCRIKEASNTEIETPVKKWLSKAKEKLERKRKRDENNEEK